MKKVINDCLQFDVDQRFTIQQIHGELKGKLIELAETDFNFQQEKREAAVEKEGCVVVLPEVVE